MTFDIVMLNNFVNEACNNAGRYNSQNDHRPCNDVMVTSRSYVPCSVLDALYVLETSCRRRQSTLAKLAKSGFSTQHTHARERARLSLKNSASLVVVCMTMLPQPYWLCNTNIWYVNLMFFWPCIMNWLHINYQLDALIIIYS